jgi:hypothetical protein
VSNKALVTGAGPDGLASGIPQQETGTLMEKLLIPVIHFVLPDFFPIRRMRADFDPAFRDFEIVGDSIDRAGAILVGSPGGMAGTCVSDPRANSMNQEHKPQRIQT